MPETVENDVIRATAVMDFDGVGTVQNVYHFKMVTDTTLEDDEVATDLCARLEVYYDIIDGQLTDLLTFDYINLFNVTQNEPLGNWDWPTLTAGLNAAESCPPGTAALAFARTGENRVIGKKYLGPFTVNDLEDGHWKTSLIALVADFITNWIAQSFVGTNAVWEQGVWASVLAAFKQFINGQAKARVAYQRRRKPGVGA